MPHCLKIVNLGDILIAVNLPQNAALGGLPAEVAHGNLVLADVRFLHLRRQIRADGDFVVTSADAVGVGVGLALLARGGHFDFVSEHRLFFRRDAQRGLQVEGDGKLAAFVGAALAEADLLVLDGRVPPPPATPRERGLADNAITVFHIVQAETCVGFHVAAHRNLLVKFVLLFRALKVDLEGRAFVLLHANGGVAAVRIKAEHTIQSVGGNDKRAAERPVFVSGELGRADFLPVGIAEGNVFRITIHEAQIFALAARHNALEINGLPGTIDGAVGEEFGLVTLIIVLVTRIEVVAVVRQQVVIALAQVDIERVVALFRQFHDAIAVGLGRLDDDGLVLAGFVVPFAAPHFHGDAFHSFPRFAVDDGDRHLILNLVGDVAKT